MKYILKLAFFPAVDLKGKGFGKQPRCIVGFNLGEMTEDEAEALRARIAKENPWLSVLMSEVPEVPEASEVAVMSGYEAQRYPRRLFLKMYDYQVGVKDFGLRADDEFVRGSMEGKRCD